MFQDAMGSTMFGVVIAMNSRNAFCQFQSRAAGYIPLAVVLLGREFIKQHLVYACECK